MPQESHTQENGTQTQERAVIKAMMLELMKRAIKSSGMHIKVVETIAPRRYHYGYVEGAAGLAGKHFSNLATALNGSFLFTAEKLSAETVDGLIVHEVLKPHEDFAAQMDGIFKASDLSKSEIAARMNLPIEDLEGIFCHRCLTQSDHQVRLAWRICSIFAVTKHRCVITFTPRIE